MLGLNDLIYEGVLLLLYNKLIRLLRVWINHLHRYLWIRWLMCCDSFHLRIDAASIASALAMIKGASYCMLLLVAHTLFTRVASWWFSVISWRRGSWHFSVFWNIGWLRWMASRLIRTRHLLIHYCSHRCTFINHTACTLDGAETLLASVLCNYPRDYLLSFWIRSYIFRRQ